MLKAIFFGLIEGLLRNISGPLGRKLRYLYYKHRFASCGDNVYIDEGVIFERPEFMNIGDNVWIDKYVVLIAGKISNHSKENINYVKSDLDIQEGILSIGSNSHIGIYTIIQAHAGVKIADFFTSSSGSKVYSLSNDYKKTKSGVLNHGPYVSSPIEIKRNVWLGINSIILGGVIEDDVFISPNSVVIKSIEKNSFASGNPAKKIKNRFVLEDI